MEKDAIKIEIDCDGLLCGKCQYMEHIIDGEYVLGVKCKIFGKDLSWNKSLAKYMRLIECSRATIKPKVIHLNKNK